MADTIAIRRRIRSVSSTRQITKAQQLIAASKLKAATDAALAAQEYRVGMELAMRHTAASEDWQIHPLVGPNDSNVTRLVLIGSDRGLAGPYHLRLEQALREAVERYSAEGPVELVTIGTKAAMMGARLANVNVVERHPGLGAMPSVWEIAVPAHRLVEAYQNAEIGRAVIIATQFRSPLRQEVESSVALPLAEVAPAEGVITLEPTAEEAITAVVRNYVQSLFYDATANALASEQAMRMLAMQNATDNASDLIEEYTLAYNNARQADITQQLAEISGGVAALS